MCEREPDIQRSSRQRGYVQYHPLRDPDFGFHLRTWTLFSDVQMVVVLRRLHEYTLKANISSKRCLVWKKGWRKSAQMKMCVNLARDPLHGVHDLNVESGVAINDT